MFDMNSYEFIPWTSHLQDTQECVNYNGAAYTWVFQYEVWNEGEYMYFNMKPKFILIPYILTLNFSQHKS
jgi:hypothetical protein